MTGVIEQESDVLSCYVPSWSLPRECSSEPRQDVETREGASFSMHHLLRVGDATFPAFCGFWWSS